MADAAFPVLNILILGSVLVWLGLDYIQTRRENR